MRLLKLASARPVSRIHALPQPFVPGTDPLVTPLEGTRAGLRAKRSPAASQLTEMSPPRLCWALSPLGIRYRFLSSIASWALLPPLRLCYHISESVASRALLSPLGLYRLRQRALLSLTPSRAPAAVASRALLSLQLCYCLSSSIASRALSSFRPCYHLLGSIAPWALSPLGTSPALSPLGSAVASLALLPQSRALLPLGFFYHLLGYIAPRALLSPLGLYRVLPLGLGYRLSGSAASRAPLLPFGALSSRALPSH